MQAIHPSTINFDNDATGAPPQGFVPIAGGRYIDVRDQHIGAAPGDQ